MTGNEMLSTLGLRLEDPQESSFTQAAKIDALNIAQISVVNLVNNASSAETGGGSFVSAGPINDNTSV